MGIHFEYANRQSSTFSIKRSTGPVAWHRGHGDGMTTNHVELPVWISDECTLLQFEEDCLDDVNSTKKRERHMCATEIKQQNSISLDAQNQKKRKAAKSADRAHLERSDGVDNLLTFRGNKLEAQLEAQLITGARRHLAQWTTEHDASQVRADDQDPQSKHRAPRRRCPSHQRGTLCQDSQKQKFPGNITVRRTY